MSPSEVGERIALELIKGGIDADALPVKIAGDIKDYDAVVIGSSVYFGRWMRDAVAFVERHRAQLAKRPVWLFSVGPLGGRARTDPAVVAGLATSVNAVEHHLFAGLLDLHRLSFPERVIVKGVKAAAGDFRDWNEIDAWAGTIAHDVRLKPPSGSRPRSRLITTRSGGRNRNSRPALTTCHPPSSQAGGGSDRARPRLRDWSDRLASRPRCDAESTSWPADRNR